jgi:hypothetical protein
MGGWAKDAVGVERPSDALAAPAIAPEREDPFHHRRGLVVELQPMASSAQRRQHRVVVGTRVGQPVAVGRPSTRVASFVLCLCRHRRTDPDRDPPPLGLRQPAYIDMTRWSASESGSTGPPTSGTHSGGP